MFLKLLSFKRNFWKHLRSVHEVFIHRMSHSPHHGLSFFPYKDALALETDSSHVPDGESALKVCDTIYSTNSTTLTALKATNITATIFSPVKWSVHGFSCLDFLLVYTIIQVAPSSRLYLLLIKLSSHVQLVTIHYIMNSLSLHNNITAWFKLYTSNVCPFKQCQKKNRSRECYFQRVLNRHKSALGYPSSSSHSACGVCYCWNVSVSCGPL